ncbi:IQ calmodulin-binding domain-containing protein [Cladophialophora carrionii]|uniref:IQ calmodulin-binding domain-containing protein n=1 Tax=Cladophialophora carrionii TaxID=86049 RepID=A0A1C1CSC2_9EURO|nr:IQ calmodulin-binding domain-containing protein [Cladophialophora carrionii]
MENDAISDHTKGASQPSTDLSAEEAKKAAVLIQKTYRGHRTRRQLNGFGLDASTRWYEAVRDARFKQVTTPRPPSPGGESGSPDAEGDRTTTPSSPARAKWTRATEIARRAGADDRSPSVSDLSSSDMSEEGQGLETVPTQQEKAATRKRRAEANAVRKKTAKMMDLQYFLEMVDQKHRYGSNLRKYHNYWKTQDTDQSYFYWLDHGDGRTVELPECSRARLDREQVRYLSREERLQYLVKVNSNGLLVWAKNGELVWTKDELFKDSVNGIVPIDDPSPQWKYNVPPAGGSGSSPGSSDDSDDEDDKTEGDEGQRVRGPSKVKHVSAGVLFNHMIRTSLKNGHKWIFVADTSFRLYIGYKQSGAFQHSSFLHGARILSAGLIKVKHGQLRRLSPLSGHYRPPAANFRAFVHSLRDAGADMSHVSISRSYAVLVGLETYTKARKQLKSAEDSVVHEKDKLLDPDKVRMEEEAQRDKSQSAETERLYLKKQREAEEREVRERKAKRSLTGRLSNAIGRLKFRGGSGDNAPVGEEQAKRIMGTGPEDGVPPPEGRR